MELLDTNSILGGNKSFGGYYCQELGWDGVSHCDWTDCVYADICKAVRE